MSKGNRPQVLIISGDTIDRKMGGMGVRYWEMARALSSDCRVILAIPNDTGLSGPDFEINVFNLGKATFGFKLPWCVIILQGFFLHFHSYLGDIGAPLAVDLYIPFLLESLVWHQQADFQTWVLPTTNTCGFNWNYCGSANAFSSPAKDNGLLAGVAPYHKKRSSPTSSVRTPPFAS
jgi:hypothetical protein